MGRHAHISYCRADEEGTAMTQVQHLGQKMVPDPNKPERFSPQLVWRRQVYPYTRDEQANFAKCDAMCSGPEHAANNGQPSFCTLPMFHPPCNPNDPVTGLGYISNDGHMFDCRNPVVMQQAFMIFVIDRSCPRLNRPLMWHG
ncbi:hypothetical protein BC834DRAFT_901579 [Gloeopeniophorella convolvens]|nr:hypothetical protein BC834DRAFT_901579 [Gloeopeniophorella convolvens]